MAVVLAMKYVSPCFAPASFMHAGKSHQSQIASFVYYAYFTKWAGAADKQMDTQTDRQASSPSSLIICLP